MKTLLTRKHRFHYAHRNTKMIGDKCEALHGHTAHVDVVLVNDTKGKAVGIPFEQADSIITPVMKRLCHSLIVWEEDEVYKLLKHLDYMKFTILPVESSAENITAYLYNTLTNLGLPVHKIIFRETTSSEIHYPVNL